MIWITEEVNEIKENTFAFFFFFFSDNFYYI